MTDRCERCKKGYAGALPRDDLEWPVGKPEGGAPGGRALRIGRCTRCGTWLVDLWTTDPEREGAESHDICLVVHDAARPALMDHNPAALAAVSTQLRRRHLELLVAGISMDDRSVLEQIAQGALSATEVYRGLVTHMLAINSELPPINDVRPRAREKRSAQAAVGMRVPLELGDGSRVVLETLKDQLCLTRMRGDAATWRTVIPVAGREGFVARVSGRGNADLAVLTGLGPGETGAALCLVSAADGAMRGPARGDLRAAVFEAHALPGGCTFIASYQGGVVARADASFAWKGHAAGFPVAVPLVDGAVVTDAPWRLVALKLPEGSESWSVPIDRGAVIVGAGEGQVLLTTSDVVARLEIRGTGPRLMWLAAGGAPLALSNGGAAIVRERWERSGRVVECLVLDAKGKRRFVVPRPEASKTPVAEIGNGTLLFHSGSDVAVSVREQIAYALALPDRRPAYVTVEEDGAWIEFDGIVDRVDANGKRVGRWRVG